MKQDLDFKKLCATKHLATTTELLVADRQKIISDVMGHSMNVHQDIYQQRQAETDIVTMGEILSEATGLRPVGLLQQVTEVNCSHIKVPEINCLIGDISNCEKIINHLGTNLQESSPSNLPIENDASNSENSFTKNQNLSTILEESDTSYRESPQPLKEIQLAKCDELKGHKSINSFKQNK